MLKGTLVYDHSEDIWFISRADGAEVDISGIIYSLSALGYELEEGDTLNLTVEKV